MVSLKYNSGGEKPHLFLSGLCGADFSACGM